MFVVWNILILIEIEVELKNQGYDQLNELAFNLIPKLVIELFTELGISIWSFEQVFDSIIHIVELSSFWCGAECQSYIGV